MKNYSPYREDVFSVGIVILQMMLMYDQQDIEEIRRQPNFFMGKIVEAKFVNKRSLSFISQNQK